MNFDIAGLSPALLRTLAAQKIAVSTPVQRRVIPAVLAGSDLLVSARTGSGKTLAFALPVLQRVAEAMAMAAATAGSPPRIRTLHALVLVPTHELAVQVGEVMRGLTRTASPEAGEPHSQPEPESEPKPLPPGPATRRIKVAIVFGGVSVNPQMMALRGGADVLVATPGRLLDLVAQNAVRCSDVQMLVLDEADRLLEPGFAEELQQVLDLLPRRRQNLLLSATVTPAVEASAARLLREPVRIAMADDAPAAGLAGHLQQRAIMVDRSRRTELLRHLVQQHQWPRAMVFVATKHTADTVAAKLYRRGVFATAFHGDLSQGTRSEVLQEFRDQRWEVLVTTDLAARGIDITDLPVVLNYDLPRSATDYVHRIGRTARAGAGGLAISFVSPETAAHFRLIERRNQLQLPLEKIAGFEPKEAAGGAAQLNDQDSASDADSEPGPAQPRDPNGGIKGLRPSKKDRLRAAAAQAGAVAVKPRAIDGASVDVDAVAFTAPAAPNALAAPVRPPRPATGR